MKSLLLGATLLCMTGVVAQESLSLADLSGFEPQTGNWQIVGDVEMHPFKDIHEKESAKKKRAWFRKKKKKEKTEVKPITTSPGSGILINLPSEGKQDALLTSWEHGDIMLQLEVMLPKGSNSGIYLQGRYEIQLYDSWGVKYPKFSDIGGIYRNWENEPSKAFAGIAPSASPARPPGVWQDLRIHFRAPRFNEKGEKIENARFVSVRLNGVPIHENVEVPHATGGPVSQKETATGPLMIQGDHGPVAFRNIRYTLYESASVSVSDLTYKAYHGAFNSLEELESAELVYEGKSPFIDVRVAEKENNYGVIYEGTLKVDKADQYTLRMPYGGGGRMTLNGEVLDENNTAWSWGGLTHTANLDPGTYPFKLETIKAAGWWPPVLGFSISSPSTEPVDFHTEDSFSRLAYIVPRILVEPESGPRMLRGFVRYPGERQAHSHTMGVGTPEGVHYIYDLEAGHVLGMWRGYFIDATPMWRDRGNGSFNPQGDVSWTFSGKSIESTGGDFRSLGYTIDSESRMPIFHGKNDHWKYSEKVKPTAERKGLDIKLHFNTLEEGADAASLPAASYTLASGEIKLIEPNLYRVNNRYFIKVLDGSGLQLSEESLTLPVSTSSFHYEILW